MDDRINITNLVNLLKDRCGKIDTSKEKEYPTTRGLLMHSALIMEERILNEDTNSVGYFLMHAPFTYRTKIKICKNSEVLVPMTDYGDLIDSISNDIFNMEMEYVHITDFIPSPNTDVVLPILEINVK